MRVSHPSPIHGAGNYFFLVQYWGWAWGRLLGPGVFPDANSVLDEFQSAIDSFHGNTGAISHSKGKGEKEKLRGREGASLSLGLRGKILPSPEANSTSKWLICMAPNMILWGFLGDFGQCWLGVPKPGCFKPGCLQFLRGSVLLRSFAPFCALCAFLRTFVCALLRTFVCALLRSFALFCAHLRASASDRV